MNAMKYKFLVLLLLAGWGSSSVWAQSEETLPTDVTDYETVSVSIPASAYNADAGGTGLGAPQMARVKYNKLFPLVITSDDMGKTELTNNWAAFNGYPVHTDKGGYPTGDDYLATPYSATYATDGSTLANYPPMTFTDDTGGTHRFTATSAIWPQNYNNTNYTLMNATDAKTMLRTGWSFAQHDVDVAEGTDISWNEDESDDAKAAKAEIIAARFEPLSSTWATATNSAGLKIMVEPNGNHNYISAGISSSEICWNIFQNAITALPNLSLSLDDWAATRSDWTASGRHAAFTTFSNKPTGANERLFFQGHEAEWQNKVNTALTNNDGSKIILGGTHGIGSDVMTHLRETVQPADKAWVASADEVWEYYHIYNNAYIDDIRWSGTALSFSVHVPTYAKSMFRELTINIPGLEGGPSSTDGTVTTSGDATVVTGGYKQNASQFTLNLGLESRYLDYIDQLTTLYRNNPTNFFVKRDAQYLIDQLWPGSTKTAKQEALDKTFTYTYAVNTTLDGATGPNIIGGSVDEAQAVEYAFPRYILNGTSLYGTTPKSSRPHYVGSLDVSGDSGEKTQTITYTKQADDIVFFVEGEDLSGVTLPTQVTFDYDKTDKEEYFAMALSSRAYAGKIEVNQTATITTLPAGKYKVTFGAFDTNYSAAGSIRLYVDGDEEQSFNHTASNTLTEFTSDEFSVYNDNTPVTLKITDARSAWGATFVDYVYIQCTGAVAPSVTLTASPTSGMKKGNPITLTATATLHGNSSLNNVLYQYKQDDGDWTDIAEVTTGLVSGEGKTQTFTPTSAGSYVFRATATDNGSLSSTSEETNAIIVTNDISTVSLSSDADTATPTVGTTVTLTATATPTSGSTVTYLAIERNVSGTYTPIEDAVYSTPSAARSIRRTSSVNDATGEVTVTYEFTAASGESYDFRANATFNDGDTPATVLSTNAVASGGDGSALELTTTTPAARNLTFIVYKPDGTVEDNVSSTTSASTIAYDAALATVFSSDTNLKTLMRQYCNYTFYSDAALTNAITVADGQIGESNTVYVKWTYTDNAPVFSTGTNPDAFQYYALRNRNLRMLFMSSAISTAQWSGSKDMEDAKHAELAEYKAYHWAFIGTPYSFTIYNRGEQKYVGLNDKTLTYGDLASAQEWEMDGGRIPVNDNEKDRWGQYHGQYFLCSKKGTTDYGYTLNIHENNTQTSSSEKDKFYTYLLKYIVVPVTVYKDAAGAEDAELSKDAILRYPFYNDDGTHSAGSETITTSSVSGLLDASHEYTYYTDNTCETLLSSNPINTFGGSTQTPKVVYAMYYSAPTPPTVMLTASSATTEKGTAVTLTATATKQSGDNITNVAIEQQNADGSTYTEVASVTNGTATATYSFPADSYGDFYFRAYAVVDNDETNLKGQTDADVAVSVVFPTPKNDSYTLKLYDKSDIQVFDDISVTKAEVQAALGDALPGRYRSPFVARYKYYATQAEAKANSGTEFDWANSDATTVYVGYEVDATKMAEAKEHIIYSGLTSSEVFMHPVYRGKQSNSNDFQKRYNMQHQKWDQEKDGITPNEVNAGNLPFVDQVYMWSLGTDPYHVMLTNNHIDKYKYIKTTYNTSNYSTSVSLQDNTTYGSVFSLLYWNGNTSSEFASLRYLGDNTGDDAYKTESNAWYLCYEGGNEGCWRLYQNPTINDSYKFVIKTLPSLNVNVVNAAKEVEYTLKGYYVEGATVPNYTPFFLQRSYTSNHKYYYNSACTQYATPNGAIDGTKFDGANIYVTYSLSSDWNTENLFVVSTAGSPSYYNLNYTANTSTPYLAVDDTKKVIGLAASRTDEAQWALYGTPYALRIENRANSGYYVGIPKDAVWNTNPQVYNSFTNIISTWELAAYTNSNITEAYKPLPVIRPQGSISRETPLLHLRPNGTDPALFDHDDDKCRVTFEDATKIELILVDKSGREVFSEHVSLATITSTSGDPLSVGFRSPYAKNYKYHETAEAAQENSETGLDESALLEKGQQTVYVGYDAITAENATGTETPLKMDGSTPYRIRRNTKNTQGMHAVFGPGQSSNSSTYGWMMNNQKYDYQQNNEVKYNTLPFIDREWAWELVSDKNDPYSVKLRNKGTGMYVGCSNITGGGVRNTFVTNVEDAAEYSLLIFDGSHDYLAIYTRAENISKTGYFYFQNSDGGEWRLRDNRNMSKSDEEALAYMRVEELTTPLDIHIVAPTGTVHAGEVEATIHGYRNSSVGANTVPDFVPYFLSRAYTSDQKFYYTKEAAAAAASGTEISSVTDASITDSYGNDGVNDVFVSYTLDGSNWIPSGTTLSDEAKNANTSIVKPFYSVEGKINWYGIRSASNNSDFLKATSTELPTAIGRSTISTATDALDTENMKMSEWAFIGTPYCLQLVDRYHGMSSHLGVASEAVSNDRAYVYTNGTENTVTTFELLTGLGNTTGKLFLRPQGSLNGQTPYLYIGGNDDNMPLSRGASGTQVLELTWLKETDAKMLTFTLYDPQGNSMNSVISDFTYTGISSGEDLATLFTGTGMKRRYCEYKFYSDAERTNEVQEASNNANETVYVQWNYTADAPVFSTGSKPRDYQYYMINVSNGSNPYMMDVTGNSTDGYTLKPSSSYTTLKEGHKQFALVGTPYAFTLYSRFAGMNLKTDNNRNIVLTDEYNSATTTDIVYDLPIPVNNNITQSTQMDVRVKAAPTNHLWCSAGAFWMEATTGGFAQLMYMVVPVRVFKEGSTQLDNIVDEQEYALELNPSGTARATDARMTDSDLYRSTDTSSPNYHTKDFRHAFCDYTFYHTYDWSTGALSNAIPSTGAYAGLPYYGGSTNQFARSFFATYTVDEEQFSTIYVLDNANSNGLRFLGSNTETYNGDNVYYTLKCEVTTLEGARNDNTKAYRWQLTGDPYNLQLTCLGTGDGYQSIPLGVKTVSTTNSTSPSVDAGTLARLTNDGTYAVKSHWEVILNSAGNHVFFLTDDVTTYDDADHRYTYSLGQQNYTTASLFASSDQIYALHLTPAIPQYNVIWNIMEGGGGGYTGVATYTKENVSKGTTMTIADMPEVLKRHFCEYDNMYSEQTCTTLFVNNEATVGDGDLSIFVPYTLAAGAPTFYASVEDYTSTAGESQDPYLIRLNRTNYVKETGNNDADITTLKDQASANSVGKWVLIGSPYKVQFYNVAAQNYLYVDMTNISPNGSVPVGAASAGTDNSYWTLLNDKTGDKTAICMWENDNHQLIYLGYNGTDVVMNILSDKALASSAEFVGSNGIDGIKMRLHYGANTLRKNSEGTSMASQTETFTIYDYFNKGTKLIDVMPSVMKRAFCTYTFKYDDTEVTENDVRDIITTALVNAAKENTKIDNEGHITVDVTYTVNSPFTWSGATTGTGGYADKHWYYLVNNHVPAGSGEQGKMYYRDSSPKLRVSQSLVQSKLYLNNFEWCVIGDPYGFKMLNRYDPDHKFSEYISVMNYNDSHNDGLQLEQTDGDTQDVFEMMPGLYSYNFWMHPVYTEALRSELSADACSYVGNNYNGSAAIIPTTKKSISYLKANSSANLRLEIQSGATLAEYVKYAGFVGGLKYDAITDDDLRTAAAAGTLTDEQKADIRTLIDVPDNIEQMVQGYYRIVPFTQEGGTEHNYLRGYLDDRERTASSGYNKNLKVETQAAAEYDPASIFWFESTTSDGTANGYPRYFIKTQGLSLDHTGLNTINAESNYKCRYEDLGAAITQIKVASLTGDSPHDYISVANAAKEASTNQCFDEQAGQFKTRLYLQKVGNENDNEMPFKMRLNHGHNGTPILSGYEKWGELPCTYTSLYVPFDLEMVGDGDVKPFIGLLEHAKHASEEDYTYYLEGEKSLFCQSIDIHQNNDEWKGSNRYVPAATPVVFRSVSGVEEVTFFIPTDEPSAAITGNVLGGSYLKIEGNNDTEICLFGKESVDTDTDPYYAYTGRVGFFPRYFSGGTTDVAIPANKATYKTASVSTPGVRAIYFEFDGDATGITTVGSRPVNDGETYDLQGRRVERVSRPGVYIKNGRKIMVK